MMSSDASMLRPVAAMYFAAMHGDRAGVRAVAASQDVRTYATRDRESSLGGSPTVWRTSATRRKHCTGWRTA